MSTPIPDNNLTVKNKCPQTNVLKQTKFSCVATLTGVVNNFHVSHQGKYLLQL